MRIQSLTFLLVGLQFLGNAQTKSEKPTNPYDASTIPKALLTQQASIVYREYFVTNDLTNPSKTVKTVHRVATILREDGKSPHVATCLTRANACFIPENWS